MDRASLQALHDDRHELLATLAHEIRNPLGEIANAVRLIHRLPPGDAKSHHALESIERQVGYIDHLVRDVLETARHVAGKAQLHCETVELRRLVSDALDTCMGAIMARGQQLDVVSPEHAPVEVDAQRMRQVLVNLLANASKFSPPGAGIRIEASVEAGELVLGVEDPGRGIAADLLPHVFEPFVQPRGEGSRAGQGLGLGLAVVKSIVELHGGTVAVCSEGAGRGTKVVVRVPARRPTAAAA